MTNPVIIDLSHWNPTPDWGALLDNGTIGIIHKATESTGYKDPELMKRARPALDAGLCWSTYHFLRPGNMAAQMDHYLEVVDPKIGERMCLDHEDPGVSLKDLEDCVGYLLSARPDLKISIYSGNVIKEQLKGKRSQLLSIYTDLWLAQYGPTPSWPIETWPSWRVWQYTDKAEAIGISQPVDGNQFDGGVEDIYEWFGPNSPVIVEPIPEPEPIPPPRVGEIIISASPGLRVVVNGIAIDT